MPIRFHSAKIPAKTAVADIANKANRPMPSSELHDAAIFPRVARPAAIKKKDPAHQ
jgi:hypothetical protein